MKAPFRAFVVDQTDDGFQIRLPTGKDTRILKPLDDHPVRHPPALADCLKAKSTTRPLKFVE